MSVQHEGEDLLQAVVEMVRLHAPQEIYQEFLAWVNGSSCKRLTYVRDVARYAVQTMAPLGSLDASCAADAHRKAEQAVAFYALARWRASEIRQSAGLVSSR